MRGTGHKGIKNIGKNGFRTKLFVEDITHPDRVEVLKYDVSSESIFYYDSIPFQYADMDHYYRNKLSGIADKKLHDIVNRLAYLNGKMNQQSVKRMVEFILGNLTWMRRGTDGKLSISYEELFPVVNSMLVNVDYSNIILQNKVVFFSRYSRLTPVQKSQLTQQVRRNINTTLNGEVIHNAASAAIELSKSYMQITKPKVLKEVKAKDINTVKTLTKYMRGDTMQMLEHANGERPFKKEEIVSKFLLFSENLEKSNTELTGLLGTSRSTIVEFRKIVEKGVFKKLLT